MTAALVIVAVAGLAALLIREHMIAKERESWIAERQMLLERIQRPERPPQPTQPGRQMSAEERDHLAMRRRALSSIGTVAPPQED